MRRFILIVMVFVFLFSSTAFAVDQGAVDEYQNMLDSRHDPDNQLDQSTKDAMWQAFWKHIMITQPEPLKPEVIDESEQNEHMFPVSVIAGGNVMGYKDGSVRTAKINPIWSMCADQNDNIYFIDIDSNAVRRYNPADMTIKTFKKNDNDFDLTIALDGRRTVVDNKEALFCKVVYNPFNNGIYLGTSYTKYFNVIFRIIPDALVETYDNKRPVTSIYYNDFIKFTPTGELWYSNRYGMMGSPTRIMLGNHLDLAEPIAESSIATTKAKTSTGPRFWADAEAIITDENTMYIYETHSRMLLKYTIFPATWELIGEYDEYYDTVTSYGDKFYMSEGDSVYQLSLDGTLRKLFDNDNLKYTSGKRIEKIITMTFDTHGNLIIYDAYYDNNNHIQNGYLRKVIMN